MRVLARVLTLSFLLVMTPVVFAHDVTLSGTVRFGTIDGSADDHDGVANGVFTVNDGNLVVNGTVTCNDDPPLNGNDPACAMAFAVSGNMTINAGGSLVAENLRGTGAGGNITLTVGGSLTLKGPSGGQGGALISSGSTTTGNSPAGAITANVTGGVTLEGGSVVSAASKGDASGAIQIVAGGQIVSNGLVASGGTRTVLASKLTGAVLDGGNSGQRGGAITLKSTGFTEPSVTVGTDAVIASQGEATNAGPITLEGCGIVVRGLVASIVSGTNATANVVLRSGKDILVDAQQLGASGTGLARLRADNLNNSAANNRVDLFARETLQILGPAGAGSLYAISSSPANKKVTGGSVRVISTEDAVTVSGRAITAGLNDDENGGGRIDIAAKGNVAMNTANLAAVGDYSKIKGSAKGGTITVRSHSGNIVWTNGTGDVRPIGSGAPAAAQGTITLTACGTITTSGSTFPTTGAPVGTFPATTTGSCSPAAPSLPSGVTLPVCNTPPVANDTSATTNEDNSVTITMTGSDVDGDTLTFTIVTPPLHGSLGAITPLTPNSAQVTYSPNGDYYGPDSFTFQVSDGNGGTDTGVVSITVNPVNDAPSFSTGPDAVSDEDAGPQTFNPWATSISAGPGNESSQNVTFIIVSNSNPTLFSAGPQISSSGVLTYTSALNAHGNAIIEVRLMDDGGTANGGVDTSASQFFNIIVNSVNDAPVVNAATFSVDENSANGTNVGTVTFNDVDSGDSHTFAITSGNTNGAFAINAATGQITVANSAALNYEVTTSFALTVTVTDDGTPSLSGSNTITVNVNDKNDAPVVNAATFNVDENSANGTNVGTVNATDEDAGQTLTYAITAGNTGGAFAINASTGQISVANSAAVDFETNPSFALTVTVTDSGSPAQSASNTITINVNDVNEAPVVNAATFTVAENSANGTSVGTVTFNDPDAGQNHTFAITAGNTGGAFAINASTGEITVANSAALDFETTPSYSLTVSVTDDGSPSLSGSNTITINVTNENEAPAPSGGPFTIAENSPNGTLVGTVSANDPDAGQTHTWIITSGNTGGAFAINASGQITVANSAAVNFEVTPTFTLTVQATDNGAPALSGTTTVVINVTNVNEAPTAGNDSYQYVGNTELRIGGHAGNADAVAFTTAAAGLLANDNDPDVPPSLSVVPASGTTANGSHYAIAADGSMVYTPGPGFTGSETINYTVTDGANMASATITFTMTGTDMVWYVSNANTTSPFEGTSTHPFNTISAAQSASGDNHIIYVLRGTGAAYSDIALKNGQKLWGEAVSLIVNGSTTLITGNPANRPLLTSATDTVRITANLVNGSRIGVQVRGLDVSSSAGNGVDATSADSAALDVLIENNVISGATAEGIDINAGSIAPATVAVNDNSVTALGNGIDIARTLGSLRITSLSGNSVSGLTGGSGIVVSGIVTFDAIPGGALDPVSGGATSIGSLGSGVGGSGIVLGGTVSGSLAFTSLNIYNDAGTGLFITGTGAFTGAAGTSVSSTGGNIVSAGGPAVNADNATLGLVLATLSSTNSASAGIQLQAVTGSLTAAGGAITNAATQDVNIVTGDADVSYGGTITDDLGTLVQISSSTGGTKAFTGAITDGDDGDGSGISLTNNTGTTIRFAGGLVLSTSANAAFTATGGGTVEVCDDNPCNPNATGSLVNKITTTTATALNVTNTSIGANNLEFRSITAGTGVASAGNGITIDNTGTSAPNGGLQIKGNGTPGSGGTIQRKSGADGTASGNGVLLRDTRNASLNWMQLNDFDNSAVVGRNVHGFTMTNSVINGVIGNNTVPVEGPLNFGVSSTSNGLQGTGLIRNVKISGGVEHNVEFYNQSGSMNLTIDGVNAVSEGANPNSAADDVADTIIEENSAATGSDGVLIEMQGTATAEIVIDRVLFRDNRSQAVQVSAIGSSNVEVTIDESFVRRFDQGNEGFIVSNTTNSDVVAMISNNTINNLNGTTIFVGQTAGNATSASSLHASILNNVINMPATALNHGILAFLSSTAGQAAPARIRVDGNIVTNNSLVGTVRGILIDTPDAGTNPNTHVTVSSNSVAVTDGVNGIAGIVVQGRQASTTTANVFSNVVTFPNGNPGVAGLRIRQANTAVYNLEQSAGCTGTAAVVVACRNPGASTEVLGTVNVVAAGSTLLPNTP